MDEKDSQAVKGGKIFWYDYFDSQHHGVSPFHEIHVLVEPILSLHLLQSSLKVPQTQEKLSNGDIHGRK